MRIALGKSMQQTIDLSSKNDMHVYHGFTNGTSFAAQEDKRGTTVVPDPVDPP